MQKRTLKSMGAVLFLIIAVIFLWFYPEEHKLHYYTNQGKIFGTYYTFRYQAEKDLEKDILARLQDFDASLSTFNDTSIISRINHNENPTLNDDFLTMYATARKVADLTGGAFDITVAPLVNAWGFGLGKRQHVSDTLIDSLKQFVGYQTISVFDDRLWKTDSRTMLDASAIAKGEGCDVVATLLKNEGCTNYLIDIGGEVVSSGINEQGETWRIGITKPIDDPLGQQQDLQEIVSAPQLCMATSGNYRQFYYEDGVRRSHTIDPRTGYPVKHSLLSATVIAPSCMEADALATACMVLGTDSALLLINSLPNIECYLIYDKEDTLRIAQSQNMSQYIADR